MVISIHRLVGSIFTPLPVQVTLFCAGNQTPRQSSPVFNVASKSEDLSQCLNPNCFLPVSELVHPYHLDYSICSFRDTDGCFHFLCCFFFCKEISVSKHLYPDQKRRLNWGYSVCMLPQYEFSDPKMVTI